MAVSHLTPYRLGTAYFFSSLGQRGRKLLLRATLLRYSPYQPCLTIYCATRPHTTPQKSVIKGPNLGSKRQTVAKIRNTVWEIHPPYRKISYHLPPKPRWESGCASAAVPTAQRSYGLRASQSCHFRLQLAAGIIDCKRRVTDTVPVRQVLGPDKPDVILSSPPTQSPMSGRRHISIQTPTA